MKKAVALSIIAAIAGVYMYGLFAQPVQPQQGRHEGRQPVITSEQRAEEVAMSLRRQLDLNSKQYKKVLKLYEDRMKKVYPSSSAQSSDWSGMPGAGGPGGRPGGMSPGGGRPHGGGPPMGGDRQMGSPGQGNGPAMDRVRPGNPPVAQQMKAESEKDIDKRRNKMQKILTAEQFRRWQPVEREMLQREEEMMNRMREREAWGRME